MLMDLFYDLVPVKLKRRVHFHAFMLDIHERIHAFRSHQINENQSGDPIPTLAKDLTKEAWLLCFDEMQVTDVADAMIMRRLFEEMFNNGVVVITTSNRPPEDLYKGGLQRNLFIPFIDLLKEKCTVHVMRSKTDYRLTGTRSLKVYHSPLGKETTTELDHIFAELTSGVPSEPGLVEVYGIKLIIPTTAKGVARLSFDALCRQAYGAANYIKLAQQYHTLILDNIPKMRTEHKQDARRFITLIDALYEHKVKLVCSADTTPNQLFLGKKVNEQATEFQDIEVGDLNVSEIFTGEEEIFAFSRAVSRLQEMQTVEYLESPHLPHPYEEHSHHHHQH